MLPRRHRLTSRLDFHHVFTSPRVSVHHVFFSLSAHKCSPGEKVTKIGFIVNKTVGSAVTRNTVKRKLRGVIHRRFSELPAVDFLIIRAKPAINSATSRQLDEAMSASIQSLQTKLNKIRLVRAQHIRKEPSES